MIGDISNGSRPESSFPGVPGPPHLADPMVEDLTTIVLNLARQVWALQDRNRLLEKLLVGAGVVGAEQLDTLWPDAELAGELDAECARFVSGLFRGTSLDQTT